MSPRPVEGVTDADLDYLREATTGDPSLLSEAEARGVNAIRALLSEVERLRAEWERYEKALRKFGNHKSGCDSWRNSPQDCDCGFRAALSASAPEPKP